MLAIFFTISGSLTLIFYVFSKRSVEKYTKDYITQEFDFINNYLEHNLRHDLIKDLNMLTANPLIDDYMMSSATEKKYVSASVKKLFKKTVTLMEPYQRLSFITISGQEIISVGKDDQQAKFRDFSKTIFFQKLANSKPGSILMGHPNKNQKGETILSIGINKIDADIGKFGGAIILDFNLQYFFTFLDSVKIFGENIIWVFLPDGKIIKQPDLPEKSFDPREHISLTKHDGLHMTTVEQGVIIHRQLSFSQGKEFLHVAISLPSSLMLKDIQSTFKFFLFVFCLLFILIMLISYYLAKYLSSPINKLVDAVEEIAQGDLSTHINIKTSWEAQSLVNSFNHMADELAKTTVSKKYVNDILSSMYDSLIVVAPSGKIQTANPATYKLLNYEPPSLIGKPFKSVINKNLFPDDNWPQETDYEPLIINKEIVYFTKNDRHIPVLFSATAMHDSGKKIKAFVCLAQDISEQKAAEKKLKDFSENLKKAVKESKEMAVKAEIANQSKSQFLANMSHEIRTPLNGIIGFTNLLLDIPTSPRQMEFLGLVKTSCDRLMTLVNSVLDFSKIESETMNLETVSFNLRNTLNETLNPLLQQAKEKKLHLHWHVGDDIPDELTNDPNRLMQVVINLINNSIKFTQKGTIGLNVTVKSRTKKTLILLFSIRDTGIGVPKEHQKAIFNDFVQEDGSHTRKFEGSGLGLAISAQLVHLMGGVIWVESIAQSRQPNEEIPVEDQKGSTFYFTSCFAETAPTPSTIHHSQPTHLLQDKEDNAPKSLNVLLVEDDMNSKTLVIELIKNLNWQYTAVDNGTDAVDAVRNEYFDVILMDIQMPGMSGFEATKEIRKMQTGTGKHTPIIAMTAHALEGYREKCLKSGMDDYISKPFDIKKFVQIIKELSVKP